MAHCRRRPPYPNDTKEIAIAVGQDVNAGTITGTVRF
jgi:hypothetical protein